jgi:hypothetical protein
LTTASTVTIDGTTTDAAAAPILGPGAHRIVVSAVRVADPAALVTA